MAGASPKREPIAAGPTGPTKAPPTARDPPGGVEGKRAKVPPRANSHCDGQAASKAGGPAGPAAPVAAGGAGTDANAAARAAGLPHAMLASKAVRSGACQPGWARRQAVQRATVAGFTARQHLAAAS